MTKICKKCGAKKAKTEFHSHKQCKDGFVGKCKSCVNEAKLHSYHLNKEKWQQKNKEWRANNDRSAYYKEYRLQNKEKRINYVANNLAKFAKMSANRRARIAQRTPLWLDFVDLLEIETIYSYCSALRKIGVDCEVDHKIPLFGKTVSGLHVPTNLQVINSYDNRTKSNKWIT